MNKISQSFIDQLLTVMPELRQHYQTIVNTKYVDPNAAKKLFAIWRDGKNKVAKNTYKRPITMSISDIDNLNKEGLIKYVNDKIEITSKGGDVIKTMILGDERSSYEDDGMIIGHDQSLANTKATIKSANKFSKKYEDMWWDNFDGKPSKDI